MLDKHGPFTQTRSETDPKNLDPIRNRPDLFILLGLVVKNLWVLDPTRPDPTRTRDQSGIPENPKLIVYNRYIWLFQFIFGIMGIFLSFKF